VPERIGGWLKMGDFAVKNEQPQPADFEYQTCVLTIHVDVGKHQYN
jgi:hypothetical protein